MNTDEAHQPRAYQRLLIDQANAEMGRQRISRRELSRIAGIPRITLDRLFLCERDMNVRQWDAIATALGFDPGELARKARSEAGGEAIPPMGDHAMPPVGGDLRSLAAWLLANPDLDPELNNRLSDADSQSGVSGKRLAALRETIRLVRREELQRALDALPPSKAQGGGTATG